MLKYRDPRDLVIRLIQRSTCTVQVAAVISDNHGILSWGQNNVGFDGLGEHAEAHAIRKSNRKRLKGATIWVASIRNRNSKVINSKPCADCQRLIDKYGLKVVYRDATNKWIKD